MTTLNVLNVKLERAIVVSSVTTLRLFLLLEFAKVGPHVYTTLFDLTRARLNCKILLKHSLQKEMLSATDISSCQMLACTGKGSGELHSKNSTSMRRRSSRLSELVLISSWRTWTVWFMSAASARSDWWTASIARSSICLRVTKDSLVVLIQIRLTKINNLEKLQTEISVKNLGFETIQKNTFL